MFSKKTKHMLLTISVLISLITLLFISMNLADPYNHNNILKNIVTVKNINNKIDKDILLVRAGLVRHYNSLDNGFLNINSAFSDLKNNFSANNNKKTNKIIRLLGELDNSIQLKEEVANTLKSDIGVLRNSLMYFSLLSEELNKKFNTETNEHSHNALHQILSTDLFYLNAHILRILRNPTTLIESGLSDDINDFKKKINFVKNIYFKENLNLLSKHLGVILNRSLAVEEALHKVSSTQLSKTVDIIHRNYLDIHNQYLNISDIHLVFIYLLIIILVIYSGKLVWNISSATNDIHEMSAHLRYQKQALDAHAIVTVTDKNGIIKDLNNYFCLMFHVKEKDMIGQKHHLIDSSASRHSFLGKIFKTISSGEIWQGEIEDKTKSGNEVWLNQTIVPFIGNNGSIYQFVTIGTDITGQKIAEKDIKHQAYHDALTHLPNRRLMLDRLEQAVNICHAHNYIGSIMFIDLDRFKTINDSLGHSVGDQLLIQVAERLSHCISSKGTVARFGGDEFVVLLPEIDKNINHVILKTQQLAEDILLEISRAFEINNRTLHTNCSIGVTIFPEKNQNIQHILQQADIALYRAKDAGRDCVKFYDSTMQESVENRLLIETDIHNALTNNEFVLYLQPQYNYNKEIIGAEVLLRWIHPEKGIISPLDFIPIAEETGKIIKIGEWIFETIFLKIKSWCELNFNHIACKRIAINVSPLQFMQPYFVTLVIALIEKTGVDPSRIEFEITENMLVENTTETIEKMNALKAIGISFSIDDFGTGYSSLSYLNKMPIEKVKIDQAFIRDIHKTSSNETIVHTIIYMAKNLGMNVIAEGVETIEELECIYNLGCFNYQGFYFDKPMPIHEFETLISKQQSIA